METTNRLEYKHERIYTEDGEELKMVVKISLGDDCKNNICEWSITADIYYKKKMDIGFGVQVVVAMKK